MERRSSPTRTRPDTGVVSTYPPTGSWSCPTPTPGSPWPTSSTPRTSWRARAAQGAEALPSGGIARTGVMEMDGSGGHETLTILFTDVEGSTAFRTRAGDAAGNRVMSDHDRVVLDQVTRHEGRHVKSLGDGCLAVFTSPRRA